MRNKFLLVIAFLGCLTAGMAATPNSMYFIENLPYRVYMNPALRPACDTYVELPGVSTIGASANLGGLTLNDVLYKAPDGTMVTPMHPEFGNQQALMDKLREKQPFDASAEVAIVGFGFKVGRSGYLSINASARAEALTILPKDAFRLAMEGTTDPNGINTFDLSSLRSEATGYFDVSAGYTHEINKKWSVGGRLHILVGYANVDQRYDELYLDASKDQWVLRGKGSAGFYVPGAQVTLDEQGHLTDVTLPSDASAYFTQYQPNIGAAFDLGMSYKPIKDVNISLSVKDLGFITWGNATQLAGDVNYLYEGIDYHPNQEINYGDSLLTALKSSLNYVEGGSYTRMMRAKIYAGVEYSFLRNMMSVGLLSKTEFKSSVVEEEVTLAYNLRPCHWFALSASYSFVSGGWSTLGLGIDIKLPPFNFYVVTDYMPMYWSSESIPYRSQALNVQAGIALTFGCKKRPNVPYFEPTAF